MRSIHKTLPNKQKALLKSNIGPGKTNAASTVSFPGSCLIENCSSSKATLIELYHLKSSIIIISLADITPQINALNGKRKGTSPELETSNRRAHALIKLDAWIFHSKQIPCPAGWEARIKQCITPRDWPRIPFATCCARCFFLRVHCLPPGGEKTIGAIIKLIEEERHDPLSAHTVHVYMSFLTCAHEFGASSAHSSQTFLFIVARYNWELGAGEHDFRFRRKWNESFSMCTLRVPFYCFQMCPAR